MVRALHQAGYSPDEDMLVAMRIPAQLRVDGGDQAAG
jgi:hypothetical protein